MRRQLSARNGADVVRVRKLFRDKLEDYKARAEAIQKAEIFKEHFAISESARLKGLESPTVVGAQAANEMLDIVGIKASFVLTHLMTRFTSVPVPSTRLMSRS